MVPSVNFETPSVSFEKPDNQRNYIYYAKIKELETKISFRFVFYLNLQIFYVHLSLFFSMKFIPLVDSTSHLFVTVF